MTHRRLSLALALALLPGTAGADATAATDFTQARLLHDGRIKKTVGGFLLGVGLASIASAYFVLADGLTHCGPFGECRRGDFDAAATVGLLIGGGVTAIAGSAYLGIGDRSP